MSKYPTACGTAFQPVSVVLTRYRVRMEEEDTKAVLWANVQTLMQNEWGRENLTQFRLKAGIGASAISEIKARKRSVGFEVLEKIALAFKLQTYQLLMPALGMGGAPRSIEDLTKPEVQALERYRGIAARLPQDELKSQRLLDLLRDLAATPDDRLEQAIHQARAAITKVRYPAEPPKAEPAPPPTPKLAAKKRKRASSARGRASKRTSAPSPQARGAKKR